MSAILFLQTDFTIDRLLICWRVIANAGCEIRIKAGANELPALALIPPKPNEKPPHFVMDAAKEGKDILTHLASELSAHCIGSPPRLLTRADAETLLFQAAHTLRVRADQWRATGGKGDLPALSGNLIDYARTGRR